MVTTRPSLRRRGPRLRRTWPQRLVITVNVLALAAAATTATSLAYSNESVARIKRAYFRDGVLAEGGVAAAGEPTNLLVVGVDDATGLDPDDDVTKRPAGTKLTDTVMVVRLDPTTGSADLLSFPRDLVVEAADTGARTRINSVFSSGGPEALIATLRESFDIPIHHYLQVDFAGFRHLVEVVDGIPVQFPHPTRSRHTVELDIPEAGCWILGPRQALGFARVRKDFQVQDSDGGWHTDMGGDYSRVERQQLFVQLALRRAIAKGARNVNTLRRLVDVGITSVTVDDGLTPALLVDVGRAFRSFDPSGMSTHTLPVDEAPSGGPAYLYLREEEAEPVLAVFRGEGGDVSLPPGEVTVRVVNGTGTERQAGEVTEDLARLGFTTLLPGADVAVGFPTIIQHAPGAEAAALAVARRLAGPVAYQQRSDLGAADVVVVTGSDWLGVTDRVRPEEEVTAPSTTTTSTTTTAPSDDSTTSDPGGPLVEPVADPGDPDDPDDPEFFRVGAPVPGAPCSLTP